MKPKIDHYVMHGDIDEDMSYDFTKFYYRCLKNKITHVIIDICTDGGWVGNMNSICSIIDSPEIEWHGCVSGSAYSAGIMILRACDFAYATKRADMMFHDDIVDVKGPLEAVKYELKHTKTMMDITLEKFAEKTKKSIDWWHKSGYLTPNNEKLMTAAQALRLGVIDYIGMPSLLIKKKFEVEIEVIKA